MGIILSLQFGDREGPERRAERLREYNKHYEDRAGKKQMAHERREYKREVMALLPGGTPASHSNIEKQRESALDN